MPIASRMSWSCRLRGSWLSVRSLRIATNGSPGRSTTSRIIAVDTRMLLVSGSGAAATSRVMVNSLHGTMPSGTLRRTNFRRFFLSSATLANCLRFSTSWSGAWTTTVPAVS